MMRSYPCTIRGSALLLAGILLAGSLWACRSTSSQETGRTLDAVSVNTTLPTPTERPFAPSTSPGTPPETSVDPSPPEAAYSWDPYVFDRLSGQYKEEAVRLADAILAYDPSVPVSPGTAEVLCDNFAFEFPPAALVELTAKGDTVAITYLYSEDAHKAKLAAFEAKVNAALALLSEADSEYRRARVLYDWVVANVTYFSTDYTDKEITAFSALVAGETICYGFADAFGYLLRQTGMEAHLWRGGTYTLTGFSEHGWCYAKVGGKYYHFDPTWEYSAAKSSGINSHIYFGMSDKSRFTSLSKKCVSGFGALEETCDTTRANATLQMAN